MKKKFVSRKSPSLRHKYGTDSMGRFGNKINVFLVLLRSEQLFETCGIELCYENNSARERLFSSAVNFKRKRGWTKEPVLTVANQAGR